MSRVPDRSLTLRLALLAVLVAVGLYLALRTVPRVQRYRATEEVCAAVERGDWRSALERSEDLLAHDTAGRRAAQCRCRALVESGDPEGCIDLTERMLAGDAEGEWLPDPTLTALVVASRDEAGDPVAAAELARRGAREYPDDPLLAHQELALRSRIEDEETVLAEVARRLAPPERASPAGLVLRLEVADRRLRRQDYARALEVLGEGPDPFPGELRARWLTLRTEALAGLGREAELASAFEDWARRGGDPLELRARHAVLRSRHQIEDAEGTTVRMLAEVVAEGDRLGDSPIAKAAHERYLGTLVLQGRTDEALALYDAMEARFGTVDFLRREDVLRSASGALLARGEIGADPGSEGANPPAGTIRFLHPGARPGDRLLVSPDPGEPVDAPYAERAVPATGPAAGAVEVERTLDTWPQLWVLADSRGRVAASGAVWPRPGERVDVTIERHPPAAAEAPEPAVGRPGDGRRRVFQVILDCADWRLVRHGLARGELPFFERAVAGGRRAVLDSYPPFTSLAITRLVRPRKTGLRSLPELAHQLGGEIEGLNFVGRNPLAALEWVIPEEDQLFRTFARAGLGTVNLLHSHGSLQVGRNAEIVGPGSRVRPLPGYRSSRPLTSGEAALLGEAPGDGGTRDHLEEMAADFDVVRELVGEPEVDFVSLRVASLDLVTHGHFHQVLDAGAWDGRPLLYRVYRYLDGRLDELHRALDGDDVLIVMSDHGIRTPMEHDRRAMFLALGAGVEPGRVDGRPPIQHVSGWVADLLGVEVDWPGAGVTAGEGGWGTD